MFFLLQLSIFTIAYMNDFKIKAYGNVILHNCSVARYFLIFFIEKLRQLTHVVGNLSHKGIARRVLPASGGKDAVGGGGGGGG